MRAVPVLLAGLLLPIAMANAQVTTNDSALDSLAPKAPARTPAHRPTRPAPHPAPAHSAPAQPAPAKPAQSAAPAAPAKPVKPEIPATPPAILALPPPVAVPLAHPPPAPVIPLADDAPGTATPIHNGMRVTFGPDRSDFSPATADALAKFASTLVDKSETSINVFAYATGTPDDPSMPRRLSLQRALAARAVLLKAGIASPRIYPRAMGPTSGAQSDRVDVVTGSNTPPPAGHAG